MKKMKMLVLFAGIIVLAGCGNKAANQDQNQPGAQDLQKSEEKGVVSSIKDAMGLGSTMKCVYKEKDENGQVITSEAYVKGQNFKTTSIVEGKKSETLMDGTAVYNWVDGEKTGTMIKIDCLEELNKDTKKPEYAEGEAPVEGNYVTEAFDGAMDVDCQETSGIDFSAPKDITFTDQCEGMKSFIESAPKLPDMPDMPNIPSGMAPSDMPKL